MSTQKKTLFKIGFLIISLALLIYKEFGTDIYRPEPQEQHWIDTVNQVLGKNNRGLPYYKESKLTGSSCELKFNSDKMADFQMFRGSVVIKSMSLILRVFTDNPKIENLTLIWCYPAEVSPGRFTEAAVITIRMSRRTVSQYKWSQMPGNSLTWAADSYVESPHLLKNSK